MYVSVSDTDELKYWENMIAQANLDTIRVEFDRLELPEHMWNSIANWVENGWMPSGFLAGMLFNRPVRDVVPRADFVNSQKLLDWCYFVQCLPIFLLREDWPGTDYIRNEIAQAGLDRIAGE